MRDRVILDLCAGSGAWSEPYVLAGYTVVRVDLPQDVRLWQRHGGVHGILAAPPCTVFSYARNRYEPSDDELRAALSVVDACVRIIHAEKPIWWALENPINKLRRYLGPPMWRFYQWEYGDTGHKPTGLWGEFKPPMPMATPWMRIKPRTFKTQCANARPGDAKTPAHFARAFFEANP